MIFSGKRFRIPDHVEDMLFGIMCRPINKKLTPGIRTVLRN